MCANVVLLVALVPVGDSAAEFSSPLEDRVKSSATNEVAGMEQTKGEATPPEREEWFRKGAWSVAFTAGAGVNITRSKHDQ